MSIIGYTKANGASVNAGDLNPLPVALYDLSGNVLVAGAGSDGRSNAEIAALRDARSYAFNGSTWDRQRGNTEGTLLPSATRTTSLTSAVQTNHNARGVHLFLNVTANPGGAETLYVGIRAHNAVLGVSGAYMVTFLIPAATNGMFELQMYPGDVNIGFASGAIWGSFKPGALPRSWVAGVGHSAGGNWTYSLDYSLIV